MDTKEYCSSTWVFWMYWGIQFFFGSNYFQFEKTKASHLESISLCSFGAILLFRDKYNNNKYNQPSLVQTVSDKILAAKYMMQKSILEIQNFAIKTILDGLGGGVEKRLRGHSLSFRATIKNITTISRFEQSIKLV